MTDKVKVLKHVAAPILYLLVDDIQTCSYLQKIRYEGWNFNFGNTPLDWIQELLE